MTTFKNNAKYAEVLFTYLELTVRDDCPFSVQDVLRTFPWRFKGGSMKEAAVGVTHNVVTSESYYPDALTRDIAKTWPHSKDCAALLRIMRRRVIAMRIRGRAYLARIGTYQMLTSKYGDESLTDVVVYTGMRAIYHLFSSVWEWSESGRPAKEWESMCLYIKEMVLAGAGVSRMSAAHSNQCRASFVTMLARSRVPALLSVVLQAKELIRLMCGKRSRALARGQGFMMREKWEADISTNRQPKMIDSGLDTPGFSARIGPVVLKVSQGVALLGKGRERYALGRSDSERFHQLVMSTVSALVGVCAQASVGTDIQKAIAAKGMVVAERNLSRIVESSKLVDLGDEVLICKGYRRAYTAHLGYLAGPLAAAETAVLVAEAAETARPGVLDVAGFLEDARGLDAATSLNVCKMFKVCPAPDVSPGAAMMDRIKQIANGNTMIPSVVDSFTAELRSQILRAHIRHGKQKMRLRDPDNIPKWWGDFLQKDYDRVPSEEIHEYVVWEGTARMPDISPHDPSHWKDSGLGADTKEEAMSIRTPKHLRNMITRLVFDEECPMPGRPRLGSEHVIKFFVKAEGHKEPARGIFSANLMDRQAQSWMERAVEQVAREHPSFMIGQPVDKKLERISSLTEPPKDHSWIAMYYSFDISGWSAKMPSLPQRISHKIWAELFDHELFYRATEINEGAYIYLNMDGYVGWFENTGANLEGFNGKEMTMILVALLSLSVKRWRTRVIDAEIMTERVAKSVSALLFAYIDDGLSRIDLPRTVALRAFTLYKETVIDTFESCGFTVEVSKCFPSDRLSIFLNEVYLAGRHVVHGVRAAMAISAEPTERHNSLVARVDSVANGSRGAVMAGLNPLAGTMLMAYHTFLHILEWCNERDPVILTTWSFAPRAWGGLGMPNMLQLYTSGSGSAFEEGVGTMQAYASMNLSAKTAYLALCRTELQERSATSVLTAPLSGRVSEGYMVDSRVSVLVRRALEKKMEDGRLSSYAERLLKYANPMSFEEYATAIVPLGEKEVAQEQMLVNLCEAHPHSVFSAFAARLEKSSTVLSLMGVRNFVELIRANRAEAVRSAEVFRCRFA